VGFFICHPCSKRASCALAYSFQLDPYHSKAIRWHNTYFGFVDGGKHFFEWSVDGKLVTGVELQLSDMSLLSPRNLLEAIPCVTWCGPFPTLWFSEARTGGPKNKPDWECFFYRSKDNEWVVALGTNFLTNDEVDGLRRLCEEYEDGSIEELE
jgi:hypothetical protein